MSLGETALIANSLAGQPVICTLSVFYRVHILSSHLELSQLTFLLLHVHTHCILHCTVKTIISAGMVPHMERKRSCNCVHACEDHCSLSSALKSQRNCNDVIPPKSASHDVKEKTGAQVSNSQCCQWVHDCGMFWSHSFYLRSIATKRHKHWPLSASQRSRTLPLGRLYAVMAWSEGTSFSRRRRPLLLLSARHSTCELHWAAWSMGLHDDFLYEILPSKWHC